MKKASEYFKNMHPSKFKRRSKLVSNGGVFIEGIFMVVMMEHTILISGNMQINLPKWWKDNR